MKKKTKKMKIRLALRQEGHFYNAYLALYDTMDGAKLLGSVIMGAAHKDPQVRADFQTLMQRVLEGAIKDVTGKPPEEWFTQPAPESERSGNA
jgi:hypothetical protein